VLLDVDVLNGLLEQFFLVSHSDQDINLRLDAGPTDP
jgi:hypothetical protein